MNSLHPVLHGLAIKKHATAAAVATFVGQPVERVTGLLDAAVAGGRVVEANGKYLLAPLARVVLDFDYSGIYADLRTDTGFIDAYESFERINVQLKALITDWQTIEVGGSRVVNDHGNKAHDDKLIDRLGDLHERAGPVLAKLAQGLPRLAYYANGLTAALEKAEIGDIAWVSDARIDSYHTLWFELHEDLLRIVGRTRTE